MEGWSFDRERFIDTAIWISDKFQIFFFFERGLIYYTICVAFHRRCLCSLSNLTLKSTNHQALCDTKLHRSKHDILNRKGNHSNKHCVSCRPSQRPVSDYHNSWHRTLWRRGLEVLRIHVHGHDVRVSIKNITEVRHWLTRDCVLQAGGQPNSVHKTVAF